MFIFETIAKHRSPAAGAEEWLSHARAFGGTTRGGGGVLPYMGYIVMCGAKGYGFSAVLVINRVSLLAILPPFW